MQSILLLKHYQWHTHHRRLLLNQNFQILLQQYFLHQIFSNPLLILLIPQFLYLYLFQLLLLLLLYLYQISLIPVLRLVLHDCLLQYQLFHHLHKIQYHYLPRSLLFHPNRNFPIFLWIYSQQKA